MVSGCPAKYDDFLKQFAESVVDFDDLRVKDLEQVCLRKSLSVKMAILWVTLGLRVASSS